MSKNEIRIICYIFQISDPCSAGTYRPQDQTVCVPCEEGTVSTETGATSCTSCNPGKQANSDKTLCSEYDPEGGAGVATSSFAVGSTTGFCRLFVKIE